MTAAPRPRLTAVTEGAKVTPVELLFDLVFVYGFTQVTALMAHDPTWPVIVRSLCLLGLLWWLWTGFAWLGNVVQADEGPVRLILFAVMALLFIIDVTIPEAFHDNPGGLYGPFVFAVCYLIVQLIHNGSLFVAATGSPAAQRNTLLLLIPHLLTTALLLWAGTQHDWPQTWLWAAALAVTTGGIFLIRPEGWQLSAASHFSERHALMIIIALGESIVSIGVGVSQIPVSWAIIAASVLGIAVTAALWWVYFDVTAIMAEHALHHADDNARARLARDAYTYCHMPMIVGIILMSLGLKKVFEHLSDPLTTVGIVALFGGVALYLLAHVAFSWRTVHLLKPFRLGAALIMLALIPAVLAMRLPALVDLCILVAVLVALVIVEFRRHATIRHRIRHGDPGAALAY
ncbi:low temperature requirement protein A [Catelliglobosispora koreensis]|uniref:low temperature requirement protein A n=1 Tax=Catelliglobosispora koreensis TaxID=129052 RepID=UPI00047583D5|nr:low temperature requirement protein A [Catelliglobosispora koreensis]